MKLKNTADYIPFSNSIGSHAEVISFDWPFTGYVRKIFIIRILREIILSLESVE